MLRRFPQLVFSNGKDKLKLYAEHELQWQPLFPGEICRVDGSKRGGIKRLDIKRWEHDGCSDLR